MPLQLSTIETELVSFMGSPSNYPSDISEMAEKHAEALKNYASSIVPATTPVALDGAKSAMKSSLITVTASAGDFSAKYKSGIAAFASSIAAGMAPTFSATPPSTPIDLTPMETAGMNGASGQQCANILAGIIDAWFRTGTATNNNSGATTNWN